MNVYEIPASPAPQTFRARVGDATYRFTLAWNAAAECWVASARDLAGDYLLRGVPLVTGADLLGQFAYLGLGFAAVARTDHDPDAPPTFQNLGIAGRLFAVTP